MARPWTTYDLDDTGLRTLEHPLRLRLLGLLRLDGPATATQLARRIDESSGVTSYHLRKLAEAGFVEEDADRGTRRERWWRSIHQATRFSPADFLGDPEAHRASVGMRREMNRWKQRLVEQWLVEETDWDKAWVDAAGSSDRLLRLTPARAKALQDEILEVVSRYDEDLPADDDPDAERVIWFQHVVPVRELPF